MRLDDLDPSNNVRDLGSGGGGRGGGGGGGLPILGLLLPFLFRGKMGCGTIVLLLIVGGVFLMSGGLGGLTGGGPATAPAQREQGGTAGQQGAQVCNTQERMFACRVMSSTEQVWTQLFAAQGQRYQPPTLNFYTQGAQSGCGFASSAAGPFYCPSDQGVFLDTTFFDELANRFGAKGDFAAAYVIGHEVGHHIQNLTGAAQRASQARQGGRSAGNAASVKLELQADCYAGVWAARSGRLEPGDIEEGMTAANAIGDDTLQKQGGQGTVVPDSFTHGSSADRMRWLKRGLDTGDPAACETGI
ncbi:KPN_02809 family neutral zinc metallopeptidase [Sphingomonas sp.]|uniref:KPN_02809 family neutral zinc metallopeptidase n=1 Tax=Sphingomonas sp. TaxID=28214 RepID=UPI002DD65AE9|nr:neutral zinc metallopeptidase [Sphingomonas sp.]